MPTNVKLGRRVQTVAAFQNSPQCNTSLNYPQNSGGRTLKKCSKYSFLYQKCFGFCTLIIFIHQVSWSNLAAIWHYFYNGLAPFQTIQLSEKVFHILGNAWVFLVCALCLQLWFNNGRNFSKSVLQYKNMNTWCCCFILKVWTYSILTIKNKHPFLSRHSSRWTPPVRTRRGRATESQQAIGGGCRQSRLAAVQAGNTSEWGRAQCGGSGSAASEKRRASGDRDGHYGQLAHELQEVTATERRTDRDGG